MVVSKNKSANDKIYSAGELRKMTNKKKCQDALARGHDDNPHRVARAIAWLEIAQHSNCDEIRFMLHWISFNALYGQGDKVHKSGGTDISMIENFLKAVVPHGEEHLWRVLEENANSAQKILYLRQTYKRFWDAMYDERDRRCWEEEFKAENDKAMKAYEKRNIAYEKRNIMEFLAILFRRLYVVRNQLMHGAASANINNHSRRNRTQVKNGIELLSKLVPTFVYIVAQADDINLGQIPYPRVGKRPDEKCQPPKLY